MSKVIPISPPPAAPAEINDDDMLVTLRVWQLRALIREELAGNGDSRPALLTAEKLAEKLQVNKATVYDWVKTNSIPYYQAGRFVRFNLQEVLQAQKKN